ncbi:MAG: hypothetical protein K0R69_3294 [Clostridia bacterium]|nr:hypothetical protein [Clostridia bacterium]
MGRKSCEVTTLHGFKIEELVELKDDTNNRFSRLVLTIITMKHYGYSNIEIKKATGLSNPTIVKHVT